MSGTEQTFGAVIRLTRGRLRKDAVLFGESQSRVVISAMPAHRQAILDRATRYGVPVEVMGAISGTRLMVYIGDEHSTEKVIDQPVAMLHDRWALSLERTLGEA
jgi:phosphoribosylformylglycinamidine synthase